MTAHAQLDTRWQNFIRFDKIIDSKTNGLTKLIKISEYKCTRDEIRSAWEQVIYVGS